MRLFSIALAAVLTADQEVKSSEAAFEETDQIDTRLQAAGKVDVMRRM